jgi:hypothetical protein
LFFPSFHFWNSFNRSHFPIYVHEHIFPPYSPFYTLSPHPPPPTGTNPPGRTCSALLFSDFVKEKKWHFSLFKMATQGVSL